MGSLTRELPRLSPVTSSTHPLTKGQGTQEVVECRTVDLTVTTLRGAEKILEGDEI